MQGVIKGNYINCTTISTEKAINNIPANTHTHTQVKYTHKCIFIFQSCLSIFKSLATLEKTVDTFSIELKYSEGELIFVHRLKTGQ